MSISTIYKKEKVSEMQVNMNPSASFGMAVKVDPSAQRVIKAQTSELSEKAYNNFWNNFNDIVSRQEGNPVDILIRRCKHRDALAAEVVDHSDFPMKNTVYSQSTLFPGGLKFMERAEKKANRIDNVNDRIGTYKPATENDYKAGKLVEEIDVDGEHLDLDA